MQSAQRRRAKNLNHIKMRIKLENAKKELVTMQKISEVNNLIHMTERDPDLGQKKDDESDN